MLSFFFVIVYMFLLSGKESVQGCFFYDLFIRVLLLEMQLLRDEKVGVRLTSLIPPYLCTCPKP